jgi:hypothetical protein
MIGARVFSEVKALCYAPGMDWEPLTEAQLDGMPDAEIKERARLVHEQRSGRTVGPNPLTEAQCQALAWVGEQVREATAVVKQAEDAREAIERTRNRLVRSIRLQYPEYRDLVSRVAACLGHKDKATVHKILRGAGYGKDGHRRGLSV